MNKKQIKMLLATLILFCGLLLWSASVSAQKWQEIEPGVKFTTVDDSIWVFKIMKPFRLRVGYNEGHKTLPEWMKSYKVPMGINLGMFHDGIHPSGYTKINGVVIQPEIASYNLFMVWSRGLFKILDRTTIPMSEIMMWPNISQNIRMIKPSGERNRWKELTKKWSVSTIASDKDNNIYLIHSRKAYNMRDFSDKLLEANIGIEYMLYTEGGPESSLIVYDKQRMGSYETDFNENNDNHNFWYLPFALLINKL